MNGSLTLVGMAALGAMTLVGCAEPVAPTETHHHTESREEMGGGGDPIVLTVDDSTVQWVAYEGTQGNVIVCASSADPNLVAQIKSAGDTPNVVVAHKDGTYEARQTDRPRYEDDSIYCDADQGGGPAYLFQLRDANIDWLSTDLSASFTNGFTGKAFECDTSFSLSGLDLDVSGFHVENGTLHQPDVTLKLSGESQTAITGHCSLHASSGPMVFLAGPVPVEYEIEVSVGLSVSLSKASHFSAKVGTTGDNGFETDDPEIEITPEVELGVTFYGVVGTYVGVELPLTIATHSPCTPDVTLQPEIKVGAEAGLLGIGDLPISKALSVEVSAPILPPLQIATSQCN